MTVGKIRLVHMCAVTKNQRIRQQGLRRVGSQYCFVQAMTIIYIYAWGVRLASCSPDMSCVAG